MARSIISGGVPAPVARKLIRNGVAIAVSAAILSGGEWNGVDITPSNFRVVSSQCYFPGNRTSKTTTSGFQRIPLKVIGGAISTIKLGFMNWYPSTGTDKTPTTIGNTLTLLKVGLELWDGSACVPVTFDDGSESRVLANPEWQAMSDEIPASAFGLSQFDDGQKFWIRVEAETPSAGNYWPYQKWSAGSVTGMHVGYFDSSATTLTNGAHNTGSPVYTGTAPGTSVFPMPVIVVGKYLDVNDDRSLIAMGSSIDLGASDNDTYNWDAETGHGFIGRVCYRENIPMMNLGIYGGTSFAYANKPEAFDPWFQYARFALEGIGNNDLGAGYTAAAIEGRLVTRAANMRLAGIEKIARFTLSPRTDSTDDHATFANQTISTYFGPGTHAETLHDWFVNDSVSAGVYDEIIDVTVTDAIEDRWYWAYNGTANWATADGIHPSPTMSVLIAGEIQPQVAALVA